MMIFSIILALIPGILISLFIIRQDRYEKEPRLFLAISFAMGMVIPMIAYFIEKWGDDKMQIYAATHQLDYYEHFGILMLSAFIITALTEETLKYLMLLVFPYQTKDFNEPMDGIVYSVMIAMGFATVENVFYAYQYGWETTLIRAFTAVPAHAVFGIILGYYAGLAKFNKDQQYKYLLIGFLIAVFVHGLYDFFIIQEYEDWLMIVATVILVIGLLIARKFILDHQKNSPFHPKLETEPAIASTQNFAKVETIVTVETVITEEIIEKENEILSAVLNEMKTQDSSLNKEEE